MRKYSILLFLLSIFCGKTLFGQPTTFSRVYGGADYDEARSVQQTFDGGYIIVGSTSSFGNGTSDIYVIKTDSLGLEEWIREYGGSNIDRGYSVIQLADSGYAFCGFTNSFGNGGYDAYLIRINPIGDTLWTKTFGGSEWDFAYSVKEAFDGGFILAGETFSTGSGMNDVYLIRTDGTGNLMWEKTFGGSDEDVAEDVWQNDDSTITIAGYTKSFGAGQEDAYLIKTNELGDSIWTKTYGGIATDIVNSVRQTLDTGYILAGYTKSFSVPGFADFYMIKTNNNGDTLWTQKSGSSDNKIPNSICVTSDGGFAWTGATDFSGTNDLEIWQTYSDGNWRNSTTKGGLYQDIGYAIQQTSDGGFVIVGSTESWGAGKTDAYITKMDWSNLSSPNTPILTAVNHLVPTREIISISPNPYSYSAILNVTSEFVRSPSVFYLFDVLGNECYSKRIVDSNVELLRGNLSSGIYFYKIINEKSDVRTGKIIIR